MDQMISPELLDFYTTQPHACPYLDNRMERKILTEIKGPGARVTYNVLARAGFRRSHRYAYRPYCPQCNSCVPIRVRVEGFKPTRSMRRCSKAHDDWRGSVQPATATPEQFDLFGSYVRHRHDDGDMASMDYEQYRAMIEDSDVATRVVEFRDTHGVLRAAALVDRLEDGLSAVYSFFDPLHSHHSPGTFMVLWLIERVRDLGLPHLYLGYWVAGSDKMQYKSRFQPVEALGPDGWQPMQS